MGEDKLAYGIFTHQITILLPYIIFQSNSMRSILPTLHEHSGYDILSRLRYVEKVIVEMPDELTPEDLRQYADGELPAEILAEYPVGRASPFEKPSYVNDVTPDWQAVEQGKFIRDDTKAVFTGQMSPGLVLTWQHIMIVTVILCSMASFLLWTISLDASAPPTETERVCYIYSTSTVNLTVRDSNERELGTIEPTRGLRIDYSTSSEWYIVVLKETNRYRVTGSILNAVNLF